MHPVELGKKNRSKTAEELYSSLKLLAIDQLDQVISAVLYGASKDDEPG